MKFERILVCKRSTLGGLPVPEPILEVNDLHVYYGSSHILQGTTFAMEDHLFTMIGRNGMGKTTLVKAIMGLIPIRSGSISFRGTPLVGLKPHQIARLGIGYVPQGRHLFPSLTVDEHLRMATRNRTGTNGWNSERVYELFPRLAERKRQAGTNLSGGEQQMLAIGRALVTNPTLLIMDEPAEGLAPVVIDLLIDTCKHLADSGIAVFLVEQNLHLAASVDATAQVMLTGRIAYSGSYETLLESPQMREQYLGVGA